MTNPNYPLPPDQRLPILGERGPWHPPAQTFALGKPISETIPPAGATPPPPKSEGS